MFLAKSCHVFAEMPNSFIKVSALHKAMAEKPC